MNPNIGYGLFYFDPSSVASWAVRAEAWLVNRPRPSWRDIPSHAAFALPSENGEALVRYQAISTGIERRANYTLDELEADPLWIATEPISLREMDKARRWADWQAGGRYAWLEIAEVFADDVLPAFLRIMGRHPGEAICSTLLQGALVVGGRRFVPPHLVCTPYDVRLIMQRLREDTPPAGFAGTLPDTERGGLVISLQETGEPQARIPISS